MHIPNHDPIADALGVRPLNQLEVIETKPLKPVVETALKEYRIEPSETDIEDDFILARKSIREAIETATDALGDLVEVAKQSEHPRAYEVVSTMVNTIASTADKLLDISKKKKDLNPKRDSDGPTTVNNNLIMTTADVLKMIRGDKSE